MFSYCQYEKRLGLKIWIEKMVTYDAFTLDVKSMIRCSTLESLTPSVNAPLCTALFWPNGFQVLGDDKWNCVFIQSGGGDLSSKRSLSSQVRTGRGLRAGGSTLVLWLRLPSPRFLFLPFPSPVSRQINSSPIVSGNLWKSLNVQDGIHAGEVSFLSSMWFACGPEIWWDLVSLSFDETFGWFRRQMKPFTVRADCSLLHLLFNFYLCLMHS
jgi:hypothetical protein